MDLKSNLSCDYLIVTDGKDLTQSKAHIVKNTLETLPSPLRVLIRNIYDQDKIKCQKVVFILPSRVTFLKVVRDWLNALKGITNKNKQVLVLLHKLDTEVEGQTAAASDDVIAAIKSENGIERIESVSNFKNLASWWPVVIKFLMKVNISQKEIVSYKLKIEMPQREASKLTETLLDILSSFDLEENHSSDNIVRIINKSNENEENYSDDHAGTYIYKMCDSSELSKSILVMLIDLNVIQTKQVMHVMCAGRKAIACLKSVLFCVFFLITCIMNVPFYALHIPLTSFLSLFTPATAVLVSLAMFYMISAEPTAMFVGLHNIYASIVFGILIVLLWKIEFWISIFIVIYTVLWPIILNDFLVLSYKYDYGVASLTFVLWKKIDFGLIQFLHRFLNIARKNRRIKFMNPVFRTIFTLIHIPFILLYCILFVPIIWFCDCKKSVKYLFTFYTNFTLSLGSFVGGCYLLFNERNIVDHSSQIPTEAIVLLIISFYIFFFLCICHNYCWTNFNMTYGILTSQMKTISNILKECRGT